MDSEWHWPKEPEFCEAWRGCVYTPPYELHCTGPGPIPGFPSRLPERLDPRLKKVSANFYDINHHPGTIIPRLEYLNLSHNVITKLSRLALQQTTLRVLDLSHNNITHISSFHLPTSGTLDELILTGNNITAYTPLALYSAMSRCRSSQANTTEDVILSFGMVLEAPGCKLEVDAGYESAVSPALPSGRIYCVKPRCDENLQASLSEPCDTREPALSLETYALPARCDSIQDCAAGEDEAFCQGNLELKELQDEGAFGVCEALATYIVPTYAIRYGVCTIPLTSTARKLFYGAESLIIPLGVFPQLPLIGSVSNQFTALIEAASRGNRLRISVNYTLSTVSNETVLRCSLKYILSSSTDPGILSTALQDQTPSAAEPVTTQAPGTDRRQNESIATAAIIVGAATGALLLLLISAYIALSRRRASRRRHRLDRLAPLISEALIAQVCSYFRLSFI